MKSAGIRVAAVVAVSLALAACGSNSAGNSNPAPTAPRPSIGAAPATPPSIGLSPTSAPSPAAVKVKMGGTLSVGLGADAVNLDSIKSSTTSDAYVESLVTEPLFTVDANFKVVGNLVDSVDNPDATSYVFHLHPGIKFQDGTAFDAEAVRWNLQRHIDNKASVRNGDVKQIAGMEVVDPLTLKIALDAPYAPFLSKLIGGAGFMYSPATYQKLGADKIAGDLTDIGTGPFKFVSWQHDQQIVLARNPNYWRKDENGVQYPYLDGVVLRPIRDENTRLVNLQTGDLDYIEAPPPKDIKALQSNSDITYKQIPGFGLDLIALETEKEPFNDKRVREAFAYAIDRQQIVDNAYFGLRVAGDTEIPGTVAGAVSGPYLKQDIAKAKELLQQAGKQSVSFSLQFPGSSPVYTQEAELIKDQVQDAGFDVQLQPVDFAALVGNATKGNYQAAALGYNGSPDADSFSYGLLKSDGGFNIPHYKNPALDELLVKAQQTIDPQDRIALYKQIMAVAADEEPFVVNNYGVFQQATRKSVQNFPLGPALWTQLYKVWKSA